MDTLNLCRDCGANLTGDEPHRETCRHFYDAGEAREEAEAQRKADEDGPSDRLSDAWSGGFAENQLAMTTIATTCSTLCTYCEEDGATIITRDGAMHRKCAQEMEMLDCVPEGITAEQDLRFQRAAERADASRHGGYNDGGR